MRVTKLLLLAALVSAITSTALADSLTCDMSQYKAAPGITATMEANQLVVIWTGQAGDELRARYAIDAGKPVIRDLAIRRKGGQWATLGQNLTPEYRVTSGIRRMSEQQAQPLRAAGIEVTQAVIDKNRWYAFWDAPLIMPDGPEMRGASNSSLSWAASLARGDSARQRVVHHHDLQCEDRRSQLGRHVSRPLDGHLRGRSALHGL
jgi:hypothetical protein